MEKYNLTNISFYFDGFWPGFFEDEQNNISFFEKIFSNFTVNKKLNLVKNIDDADIIITVGSHTKKPSNKNKILIIFLCEPHKNDIYQFDTIDIILGGGSHLKSNKVILCPLFLSFIHSNNFLPKLIDRPIRKTIPPNFCCMLVSTDHDGSRLNFLNIISQYKKVHSTGLLLNNTGFLVTYRYGSPEFYQFISNYKFVIVRENTKIDNYITEKIFHGYLSGTVPIYWGSDHITEIFNPNSMILLENDTPDDYIKILNEIITLDNNDDLWLEKVNQNVFNNNKIPEYLELDYIQDKLINAISSKL